MLTLASAIVAPRPILQLPHPSSRLAFLRRPDVTRIKLGLLSASRPGATRVGGRLNTSAHTTQALMMRFVLSSVGSWGLVLDGVS